MSAIRLVVGVATLVVTAAQHPTVRAGIRTLANNPRAREAAIEATRVAAYNAGVIARRIVPRKLID